MTKQELRNEIKQLRRQLGADYKREASAAMQERILASAEFRQAETIFVYVNMPWEPATGRLIEQALAAGKRVFVPKCLPDRQMAAVELASPADLAPGTMGIPEPADCSRTVQPEELNLILVPCVSAWKDGSRLGHGGGYYDIFLERSPAVKLCLCFEKLLRPDIPMGDRDIRMDLLATENGIIDCKTE